MPDVNRHHVWRGKKSFLHSLVNSEVVLSQLFPLKKALPKKCNTAQPLHSPSIISLIFLSPRFHLSPARTWTRKERERRRRRRENVRGQKKIPPPCTSAASDRGGGGRGEIACVYGDGGRGGERRAFWLLAYDALWAAEIEGEEEESNRGRRLRGEFHQ